MTEPTKDYDLDQVAEAMGMSERWVREEIKKKKPLHTRYGQKIRFTEAQLAAFKAMYETNKVPTRSITTGKKKAS